MSLLHFILGRPLANREQEKEKIGALEGVPAMGLDGLASSAYGPEAALTILMPLGALGTGLIGWVMAPILALLGILYISYRQTIRAYPSNGGAYTVSKENLGIHAALLAAAALMIDYVLNVAVGISAGVGALTSALPMLHPYTLALCLAILAILTLMNLRGTQEASRLFAVPTFLFAGSFIVIIGVGAYQAIASGGHPRPVVAPPLLPTGTGLLTVWLFLRAFASGCTAMTGVEAVSNGVGAFRAPVVKEAHLTLTAICALLAVLLAGIAYLAQAYGIAAMDETQPGYQSVLSQLAMAVTGRGVFYYVAIGSVLCVLCLSANTSFTGFPRLCRLVAEDDFLPRPFATAGRRLVYSVGILYLAAASGLLLILFGGITDRLIPLFAIGAFLTFTLSQTGMVVHWRRELRLAPRRKRKHLHRGSLAINALGALTTAAALAIILAAKFSEGAWIAVLAIGAVILLLKSVKSYYRRLNRQLHEERPLDLSGAQPPLVLVTTRGLDRLTRRAVAFALQISPEVYAVHLSKLTGPDCRDREDLMRQKWSRDFETPARQAGLRPPRLLFLQAPYRRIHVPLLGLIEKLQREHPGRMVAVLIPVVVKRHWWEHLLHSHRADRLRLALLRYGSAQLVVTLLPWHLDLPAPTEAPAAGPDGRHEAAGDKPRQRAVAGE